MSNIVNVQSPLYHADFESLASVTKEGGVSLREAKLLGHLNLRGNSDSPEFKNGVEKALGLTLPLTPCTSLQNDDATIMWLSPDEWLIIVEGGQEATVEETLRANITGHFAVSDISGGQTILEISGPDCIKVMQKSTGYDFHLKQFPVGKVIGTAFAKSSTYIRRTSYDSFQLVVRRSFADYFWLWLQQSSKEYGLRITL
ncbi:sarcosine oxidase subunit gamma family protein [Alteromonas sp. 1_MG-2023]|uniref:sarcosine oxidase subunit gamma n=1 Tax=Alteromonas sp. 1_MG-2023 TaxID=3062669 RepID=UPI0026E41533|nr:sarcosine oxidase subunit gamma family protein [Alteromonas sp. 1_MG-2023]MDO6566528.1 sarcosine oxidase subunit gamma family protein [Alteromonas sp. 1_MG-2023]